MNDRAWFQIELRRALTEAGVSLVSAELHNQRTVGFTWQVTVNHPQTGVAIYQAPFGAVGEGPHAASTLEALLPRLFKAMPHVF